MKIIYTLPGISVPHGGYRIVLEHLTRLKVIGHEVSLYVESGRTQCPWYPHSISITGNRSVIDSADIVVIGSPHSIWVQDYLRPGQRCFLFMQMVEHLFKSHDKIFVEQCGKFYSSPHPIIHGSKWGGRYLRAGITHYLGNGVNLEHFPIVNRPKTGDTVLVEGWEASNPAKDIEGLGPRVAGWLKKDGYKIITYGHHKIRTRPDIPDEYYQCPSLEKMNELYNRATILLKATRYDARALSPMEAMTKGTVTARAIIEGDDDLMDGYNSVRVGYDANDLYSAAVSLLTDEHRRETLAENCRNYVKENNWDKIIEQLNRILCD